MTNKRIEKEATNFAAKQQKFIGIATDIKCLINYLDKQHLINKKDYLKFYEENYDKEEKNITQQVILIKARMLSEEKNNKKGFIKKILSIFKKKK